jgi:hypothetical protein
LTHWEIKLAWSEYKQNKWGPKQSAEGFIDSPNVTRNLESVIGNLNSSQKNQQPPVVQDLISFIEDNDFPPGNTIVQLYLPTKEEHFLKTTIESDELVLKVYRRYSLDFRMFGHSFSAGLTHMQGYDYLGHFSTSCGAKVRAANEPSDSQRRAFDSLAAPISCTNSFMTLSFSENVAEFLAFLDSPELFMVFSPGPGSIGKYALLDEHQVARFALKPPFQHFFYQDGHRTYFVEPFPAEAITDSFYVIPRNSKLRFKTFFHPYACSFIESLNRDGVPGLLTLKNQMREREISFADRYQPEPLVALPYPEDAVDFASDGAYSLYNWELFFHIPLLIATRLSQNQRFEEARQWFHYVFDPTNSSDHPGSKRFWRFRPFNENTEADRIQDLLKLLDYDGSDPDLLDRKQKFEDEVSEWEDNPFNPHLIARLRPVAYQKTVVMKYIDNLIAWGDNLFKQDTMETVNQATQLYVLAQDILGPRPQQVGNRGTVRIQTYRDLKGQLDQFSNSLVELENQLRFDKVPPAHETPTVYEDGRFDPIAQLQNQLSWSIQP